MSSEGKEWYIACPWGKLAIIAWGDSRSPPVLMCHGKLDTAATFAPLVRMLPPNYFYVAVDLPGCGKSDWHPPGLPMSVHDLTYALRIIIDHFRWPQLTYVGHSLGALLGYHYIAAFPGRVSRFVLLDPVPAYDVYEPEELPRWYFKFIHKYFSEEFYHKYNAPKDTAPLYTKEKIVEMLMAHRKLPLESAEVIAERCTEPAGNGLYRLTFDQRMKKVTRPPQSVENKERLYTSMTMPILAILAQDLVEMGAYIKVPFILEPSKYPRGNYQVHTVEGGHDVHLAHPARVAPHVSRFLSTVVSKL